MVFHPYQKKPFKPQISLDNCEIECVDEFNFLGIIFDKHMSWKSHINKLANKLSKYIGILNKLKRILPLNIKLTLYNSLIKPHLKYGILLWGHNCERILKLQKKIIRIITISKYNAHTDPIFKSLNILKVSDSFLLHQLNFYYNYINDKLPQYFQTLTLTRNITHDHFLRPCNIFQPNRVRHEFAKRCIRYSLPILLSQSTNNVLSKVYTHSFRGFSSYAKRIFIENYSNVCTVQNCYICNRSE